MTLAMPTLPDVSTRGPFRNEPFTDFSQPANRAAFAAALAKVKAELGRSYPLIIDGQAVTAADTGASLNPANPSEVVGRFSQADAALVDRALEAASRAFETWRHVPATERAAYLFAAADEMRRRKHEFSAWMVYEVGKSWPEADGDTAEAIDFLEYYAHEMLRLDRGAAVVPVAGEENEMVYIPLGVGAVIPPWNFPNAIMTGMTSAAIVAGNTVILKPASASPAIAWQVCQLFYDAGLPPGVLNFVPGPGAVIGDRLVDDARTRFIAFTGSKEVGLRIHERAAKHQPGQRWIKRTILEMGGKDAVVVDETADLDAAATAIVQSAFGFQGQKCSAGSRAIIVRSVYDEVVAKVVTKAQALISVGDTTSPDIYMGPVVDKTAYGKILGYIETGKGEGRLLLGGGPVAGSDGYFIEPTIIADVASDAVIAQEEIFGPVLAILPARDFDDALAIANGTEYGLTGALYSRIPERIERARREFFVGNLYFNRKCTGALVGVHPFGGFNMSGTDSKAGGPDYLLLFTQPKAMSAKLG
jgi:1-pyrroline-5-carboxylate dehydrogenase